MRKKWFFLLAVLLISLLAACTPESGTQDAMTKPEPADTKMEEQVPGTGAGAAMEKVATIEVMQDKAQDAMEVMDETSTPEMMDSTHAPMLDTETPQDDMMENKEAGLPAWFSTQLKDEGTGEAFKILDFEGKVVVVETFAQWCPTCLRQQMEIAQMQANMDMANDLIIVSLDIDPNEDAAMLQTYLEKHAFQWRFAIAPPETAREIGSLYGQQFLNPPSAPMFVIDRQGKVHALPAGLKSAMDLEEAVMPFLEEGM